MEKKKAFKRVQDRGREGVGRKKEKNVKGEINASLAQANCQSGKLGGTEMGVTMEKTVSND